MVVPGNARALAGKSEAGTFTPSFRGAARGGPHTVQGPDLPEMRGPPHGRVPLTAAPSEVFRPWGAGSQTLSPRVPPPRRPRVREVATRPASGRSCWRAPWHRGLAGRENLARGRERGRGAILPAFVAAA